VRRSAITLAIGLTAVALAAAGCTKDGRSGHDNAAVTVVASTDVWGSVASAVAGQHASVKSIESGVAADPHSYEASPADVAAMTDASLVVYNGGGYDHWVDDVLAGDSELHAIDAYSLRGTDQKANEHVFYDVGIAKAVAAKTADRLAEIEPAHAAEYRARAVEFGRQADAIAESERTIGKAHPWGSFVATEPVAYYLLRKAGITDLTPPGFASAVEEATTRPRPTSPRCST
jgi:zinc/manganese transport system substrate-binding protein